MNLVWDLRNLTLLDEGARYGLLPQYNPIHQPISHPRVNSSAIAAANFPRAGRLPSAGIRLNWLAEDLYNYDKQHPAPSARLMPGAFVGEA